MGNVRIRLYVLNMDDVNNEYEFQCYEYEVPFSIYVILISFVIRPSRNSPSRNLNEM